MRVVNLQAQPQRWALADGSAAWVVDELLADPQAWIESAAHGHKSFREREENFYPGLEWALDDELVRPLIEMFTSHLRGPLGVRRVLSAKARLSLATLQPQQLAPLQRLCHRDRFGLPDHGLIAACTLYLFDDPQLGGTGFYRPKRPVIAIDADIERWQSMSAADFTRDTGLTPAYQTSSNDHFQHIGTVPARLNRGVFYDGALFHSAHIEHPQLLSADPRRGRLTLNAFFTCRAVAS